MRDVMDGVIYDTEKSELLYKSHNMLGTGGFDQSMGWGNVWRYYRSPKGVLFCTKTHSDASWSFWKGEYILGKQYAEEFEMVFHSDTHALEMMSFRAAISEIRAAEILGLELTEA